MFGKDKFLKAAYFEHLFFLMYMVRIIEILIAFVPPASLNTALGMSSQGPLVSCSGRRSWHMVCDTSAL